MFTSQRLDASQALRGKKVQELLEYVHENCNNGQAVDIGKSVLTTVLNLISNTFFSHDIASYNSDLSQEFSDLVSGVMEYIGKPNIADYFPILRLVDPQAEENNTELSFADIQALLRDFFMAGSDTTSSTVEWAMTELLLNPDKLVKAKKRAPRSRWTSSRIRHLQGTL
ncbi:CYTOCHROME P450 FAMILY 76 SUBFAMILY C POLYPEPTIDE 5-RELATED [Salix purpurea]|uniref:CYTOCHROME P450 FAMILY 76 SUBFAMILY C POLYPEPTIDE 5-RELATED n=1 Tax=Salix purpurea TaxID=77065 RepID=A0A9Q0PE88_SALPP|nr:CYTOCHROME P450 FAMILY 76 SUBFAMILY C POLYPEPTIDE 5-RELATED [Salix purpurea]